MLFKYFFFLISQSFLDTIVFSGMSFFNFYPMEVEIFTHTNYEVCLLRHNVLNIEAQINWVLSEDELVLQPTFVRCSLIIKKQGFCRIKFNDVYRSFFNDFKGCIL